VNADVCLNANVLSVHDMNADVVLHCVDGFYVSVICASGKFCQSGHCVTLLATNTEPRVGKGTTTTSIRPNTLATTELRRATSETNGSGESTNTDIRLSTPKKSEFKSDRPRPTRRPAATSRGHTASRRVGSRKGLYMSASKPTIGPYSPWPVTSTTTEYVTISQCCNKKCYYATLCNVYPVCDVCVKPPVYLYKTKTVTTANQVDTIVYPYCEECESTTECAILPSKGCSTCSTMTITIEAGSSTAAIPVSTCSIWAPATFTYSAPTTPTIPPYPVSQSTQSPNTSVTIFKGSASASRAEVFNIFFILLVAQLIQL